jgi:protein TonB
VRAALWNQWSARMPRQGGESVTGFAILPSGEIVDLRTEESSGDSAFDLAALSAVQDAGPFPPLPRGFKEPFLKIHVTLKSR